MILNYFRLAPMAARLRSSAGTWAVFALWLCAARFTIVAVEPLDNWTVRTPPRPIDFTAITFGNGLFVAGGSRGEILTSRDGANWTEHATGIAGPVRSIAFGRDLFVAIEEGSLLAGSAILGSPNGTDWMLHRSGAGGRLRSVAFGNDRFLAVGGDFFSPGLIFTSSDSVNWTETRLSTLELKRVTFGGGTFVAIGTTVMLEPCFMTGETASYYLFASTNGINWRTTWVSPAVFYSQTTPPKVIVVTRPGTIRGNSVVSSRPGPVNPINVGKPLPRPATNVVWAPPDVCPIPVPLNAIAYGESMFVVLGNDFTLASSDGYSWVRRTGGGGSAICFGNGIFAAFGENGRIQTTRDAISWTGRNSGTTRHLVDIAFGHGTFVAVGNSGTILQSGITPAFLASEPWDADATHLNPSAPGTLNDYWSVMASAVWAYRTLPSFGIQALMTAVF